MNCRNLCVSSRERMPLLNILISYCLLCASSHGSRCFLISITPRWPTALRDDEKYKTEDLGSEREPSCPICYHGYFLGTRKISHRNRILDRANLLMGLPSKQPALPRVGLHRALPRERGLGEMKGKGCFHCVVIALDSFFSGCLLHSVHCGETPFL